MATRLLTVLILCLACPPAIAQSVASGFVEDATTGERLGGASVYARALGYGAAANTYGFFSLPFPDSSRSIRVEVRSLGFETLETELAPDSLLVIRLQPSEVNLDSLTVQASRTTERSVGNAHRITPLGIERMPALFGESDLLKAVQLLPGVAQGAEGTGGLHVRGGSPDQTLLLLDGAVVYNPSHVFGVVSVFNTDALQAADVYTGALPARYGGRLAAVVDVSMREGNRTRRAAKGSVGLLASRLTAEGPLAGGRGAYIVSGRRTYADLLARAALRISGASDFDGPGETFAPRFSFYDANAKANLDVGPRTRVYASAYGGSDGYGVRYREASNLGSELDEKGLSWSNATGTLRATHVLSPRAFLSARAVASRYRFSVSQRYERARGDGTLTEASAIAQTSSLSELTTGLTLEWEPAVRIAVSAGVEATGRSFVPVRLERSELGLGIDQIEANASAREASGFVDVGFSAAGVELRGGLRATLYDVPDLAGLSISPRASIQVPAGAWTFGGAYDHTWQPIHLLTNGGVGLPTDLWVPATGRLPPGTADQYSLSVRRAVRSWELTAAGYLRQMDRVVDYAESAGGLASGTDWESDVASGSGQAMGAELQASRTTGRLTSTLAYTLSRSTRSIPSIEEGRSYAYRYSRTHDLAATTSWSLSPRRRVGATWVYATGAAVTVPIARYGFEPQLQYGPRGGARYPAYHRLDLSYEIDYRRGSLSVGVYNAYNRLNAFSVEYVQDYDFPRGYVDRFRQLSLFPALPYVSYSFQL